MKSFPADCFEPEALSEARWFASANGIEIRIFDQQDRLTGRLLLDAGKARQGLDPACLTNLEDITASAVGSQGRSGP